MVAVMMGYWQMPVSVTQLPVGAASATAVPRLEKPLLLPAWRRPATAMAPGQLPGAFTARSSLPAEATTTTPMPLSVAMVLV